MLRKSKHGTLITCDVPGCARSFRSFSQSSLVRGQATTDGFTYEKRGSDSVKTDRCGPCSAGNASAPSAPSSPAKPVAPVAPIASVAPAAPAPMVEVAPAPAPEPMPAPDPAPAPEPIADMPPVIPEREPVVAEAPAAEMTETTTKPVSEPKAKRAPRVKPAEATQAAPKARQGRPRMEMPGTLAIVVDILREAAIPLTAREIVKRAGDRLPTKSQTPHTAVSRDLALEVKHRGASSIFVRTEPGKFTLRALVASSPDAAAPISPISRSSPGVAASPRASTPESERHAI